MTPDDVELLTRMRAGDEAAFAELFARHQGPIFRYALHMCGPAAADDVVQETFLALIRQPHGFNASRGTVGAYLFGIARHHVYKQCGLRIADCGLIEEFDDSSARSPDPGSSALAGLERAETIGLVRDAVQTLPAAYREVVVLCELQEMDYADVAAVLECPIGTVRSRLHRARALLTQKLGNLRRNLSVHR